MTKTEKAWDVIVVGSSFIDFVFIGLPAEGPALGEEVFARTMHRDIGGAAITACGLGRLGRKVALLTCVGNEDYEWFCKNLERCHVDTSLVQRSQKPMAVTFCISTVQDRSFYTYLGANADLPGLLDQDCIRQTLTNAALLHFAMAPDPLQAHLLFDQLHGAKCLISLDVGWHKPWLQDQSIATLLRQTDYFLPNEKEAQTITGKNTPEEMLRWFADAGMGCAVVKRGAGGSVMFTGGKLYEQPSISVDVVDTTGAGDCFDAGFLHNILSEAAPQDCLRLGNLCGALSTRAAGGIAGFPTIDELEKMI